MTRSTDTDNRSETTTQPDQALTKPGETGSRPGKTGSRTKLPERAVEDEVERALVVMRPETIDARLSAWLPSRVKSSIVTEWHDVEAANGVREPLIRGYRFDEPLTVAETEAAIAVLAPLNAAARDRRAHKDLVVQEVARLKVKTIDQKRSDADLRLQISAMVQELLGYPVDVVKAACHDWADANDFFPTWHALKTLCDNMVLKRRSLLAYLRATPGVEEYTLQKDGTPYNALWKDRAPAIERAIGEKEFRAWLGDVIPIRPTEPADYYQIGLATLFIARWVDQHYRAAIEQHLGQPIKIVIASASSLALAARLRREKEADARRRAQAAREGA